MDTPKVSSQYFLKILHKWLRSDANIKLNIDVATRRSQLSIIKATNVDVAMRH